MIIIFDNSDDHFPTLAGFGQPPKFNSLPLKNHRVPKRKERSLPSITFRGLGQVTVDTVDVEVSITYRNSGNT